MGIVRWDPFQELEDMNARFHRMFGRSALRHLGEGETSSMTAFDWAPSVDVSETADAFEITAELPAVKKEDVKVSVDDRVLRIEGERKQEKETKDKKYHRVERSYGSFLRTFTLPDNVDGDSVAAEYKDGVLHLRIPKTKETKPKSRNVEIR